MMGGLPSSTKTQALCKRCVSVVFTQYIPPLQYNLFSVIVFVTAGCGTCRVGIPGEMLSVVMLTNDDMVKDGVVMSKRAEDDSE